MAVKFRFTSPWEEFEYAVQTVKELLDQKKAYWLIGLLDDVDLFIDDASAEEIKLTGNDMELGIETKVKGSISERGRIALEAKIFSDIIRKLPDSDSDVACFGKDKEVWLSDSWKRVRQRRETGTAP